MSGAGVIPCGCCAGCANGTACTERTHTWCTGAKYSHVRLQVTDSGFVVGENHVVGYEGDADYKLTTQLDYDLAIDISRIQPAEVLFNFNAYRESPNVSPYTLTLLEASFEPTSAFGGGAFTPHFSRESIGDAIPDGMTLTASMTTALDVVTATGSAPSSFTETTVYERYDVQVVAYIYSTGEISITTTITAEKHIRYVADDLNWFVYPHRAQFESTSTRTMSEGEFAAYCSGTSKSTSGGSQTYGEVFTTPTNGPEPLVGNHNDSDEFSWSFGIDQYTLNDYDGGAVATFTRLADPADHFDHRLDACPNKLSIEVQKFESLDQGDAMTPENPAVVKYKTYTASTLSMVKWDSIACVIATSNGNWSGAALETLDNGDTVAGSIGIQQDNYTKEGIVYWTPSGGSQTELCRFIGNCPNSVTSTNLVTDLVALNQYRPVGGGQYYGDDLTVDESLTIEEVAGAVTGGYCDCPTDCSSLASSLAAALVVNGTPTAITLNRTATNPCGYSGGDTSPYFITAGMQGLHFVTKVYDYTVSSTVPIAELRKVCTTADTDLTGTYSQTSGSPTYAVTLSIAE